MKQNTNTGFIYYLLILIIILNISQASVLNNPLIPFILGIFVFIIHFFQAKKFDRKFLVILIIWVLISLLASIILTGNIPFLRIINYTVFLIMMPYIMINLLGQKFWIIFEKIVFFLTSISIPLYALNAVFLTEFNNLWYIFRSFTGESFGMTYPYWSAFIYVNAIYDSSFGLVRNCGFMWEPGGYSLIIIWAIIYNLRNNGNKLDRKIIIYIIALVTTFSTAGYLAVVFVVMSVYLKKLTLPNIVMISLLSAFYIFYVYRLEFVSEKIDSYITGYQDNELKYDVDGGYIKVNRLRAAVYAFQDAARFPTGYGVIKKSDISETEVVIYGTNGLGSLLVLWGFPMFIYLMVLTRRYISVISTEKINVFNANLLYAAILIMFFSNPISQNIFVYFIFFTPLVIKKIPAFTGPVNIAAMKQRSPADDSNVVKT
jgi:hypothetical protein